MPLKDNGTDLLGWPNLVLSSHALEEFTWKMVLDLDPHKFDDPVALQVAWSPVEDEMFELRLTRRIHNNSPILTFNLNYQVLISYSLVSIFFWGLLIASIISFISSIVQGCFDGTSETWIAMPIIWGMCLIFPLFHIRELKRQRTKKSSFVLRSGHYMQGGRCYPINKIHALQLISRVEWAQRRIVVHELNLILSDGRRRNLNDHENLKLIRKHARILADYLEIPIWDAVDEWKDPTIKNPHLAGLVSVWVVLSGDR